MPVILMDREHEQTVCAEHCGKPMFMSGDRIWCSVIGCDYMIKFEVYYEVKK